MICLNCLVILMAHKVQTSAVMQDAYSLHNVVLVSKLFIIEAELLNKIGRHLLHLIIRKGLARPRTIDNDIVLDLHKDGHYLRNKNIVLYSKCINMDNLDRSV